MLAQELLVSLDTLSDFGLYFISSIALTAVFLKIYISITPYAEFALISGGNVSAAYSLSGTLIGFVIPLASAISHSVGFIDMMIWGVIAMLVQILTYLTLCRMFKTLKQDIPKNDIAKGVTLGAFSVAVGILNAACMSY